MTAPPTEQARKPAPAPAPATKVPQERELKAFFALVQQYRPARSPRSHEDEPAPPPLPKRGAALLGAHLMLDQGRDIALAMTAEDVAQFANRLRASMAMPWACLEAGGDVVRFVHQMGMMAGKSHPEVDYIRAMHELLSIEEREARELERRGREARAASAAGAVAKGT